GTAYALFPAPVCTPCGRVRRSDNTRAKSRSEVWDWWLAPRQSVGVVFLGGGVRPNARFQTLCGLSGIKPRLDIETGKEKPWKLKELRKTCAPCYDGHVDRAVRDCDHFPVLSRSSGHRPRRPDAAYLAG